MEYRRLLHPLPLTLLFLFVAVAIGDLIQKVREGPTPPPQISASTVSRFEAFEPVIDFRPGRGGNTVEVLPVPELDRESWGAPERRGVWAVGDSAAFTLDVVKGGHRAMVLECLPARGKRPIRALKLTINGTDCGLQTLVPEWRRYRIALPEGVVRPGVNRIVFGFPDRDDAALQRRSLLVRRLGIFFGEGPPTADAFDVARPVTVDLDGERVAIRRAGILEVPVLLDDRTDALQLRYRFSTGTGLARVTVVQSESSVSGGDVALRKKISADEAESGRVRIPLHGRRGTYVFSVEAELETPDSRLLISSLRLVEEGDPTRRPGVADLHRRKEPDGRRPAE